MAPKSTAAGAWSYSKLSSFEECPKQYYHTTVLKQYPYVESPAMKYGKEFHSAAEHYVMSGTPLPDRFAIYEPTLRSLAEKPGVKKCELKMAVNADLEPVTYFAKDVWVRGLVDYLSIDGTHARVVDYKTGKSANYADTKQLELMALLVFAYFPEVTEVTAGLVFVIAGKLIPAKYSSALRGPMWADWIARNRAREKAHETGVFNPRQSGLCRAYCPVLECIHNGKNG